MAKRLFSLENNQFSRRILVQETTWHLLDRWGAQGKINSGVGLTAHGLTQVRVEAAQLREA